MKVKRKELIISIVVVLLIISVGAVYGLNKTKEKPKTTNHKKIENVEKRKGTKKEASKKNVTPTEKITDSNDENINSEESSTSEKNSVKTENKSTKSQVTSNKTTASNSSPTIPQEKPKRWVVDTPAWNEEVRQPVYVNTWWVKFVDGTTKIYYNKAEAYSLYRDRPDIVDSWGTGERVPDPSGATEVVGYIPHAEVGHWE
ncbi:MAG: hypothetical protein HXM12_01960 [Fusobacterium periodonticum]|nr:hypothetical protein [Fusobacterium periodonticum]